MMPRWADSQCLIVLGLTLISLVCGILGCLFLHYEHPSSAGTGAGWSFCLIGFLALLLTFCFFVKGLYRKFLDDGLDVYY